MKLKINIGYCDIDKKFYQKFKKYSWYKDNYGYVVRGFWCRKSKKSKTIKMHKIVMGNTPKGLKVDHINRDRSDNRTKNLRFVTHAQNLWNSEKKKNNSSGYKGVYFFQRTQRWVVQICANRKRYSFGSYLTKEEAALVWNREARKIHGKFAHQNKLP